MKVTGPLNTNIAFNENFRGERVAHLPANPKL